VKKPGIVQNTLLPQLKVRRAENTEKTFTAENAEKKTFNAENAENAEFFWGNSSRDAPLEPRGLLTPKEKWAGGSWF
jgi:hypothetical protein